MAFTEEMRAKAAETRRMNKEAALAAKLAAKEQAGIPDSRRFGGSPDFDTNPVLDMHVGGVLVRSLPAEVQTRILYQQTDEGIAEANRGKSTLRVSVGDDPLQKQMQRRKDDVLDRGIETWEAANPMQEVLNQHGRPGFKNRFLSDQTVKNRGMRGWQPVVNAKGEPVKLGTMVLAEMPEGKAKARNAHYQEQGNQRLRQVQQEYVESGGGTAVADQ